MLRAVAVDERDVRWEVDAPVYRVGLWYPASPPGTPVETAGHGVEVWSVTGADVEEVLAWARASVAPGGSFTVGAEVHHQATEADGLGLLWLHGHEPTRSGPPRRQAG